MRIHAADDADVRSSTEAGARATISIGVGESGGDGIAWSSVDGLTWTRLETGSIFAGAQMWAAASIRSRDVLFGTDPSNRAVIRDRRGLAPTLTRRSVARRVRFEGSSLVVGHDGDPAT